jgi:DNA-binding response OmpR family regulator
VILASDVNSALRIERRAEVKFILYDDDVPGSARYHGVATLLGTRPSACLVLLSFTTGERLRLELLRLGGYEVIRKPMVLQTLASVVTGYSALVNDIESVDSELADPPARAQQPAAKVSGAGWT